MTARDRLTRWTLMLGLVMLLWPVITGCSSEQGPITSSEFAELNDPVDISTVDPADLPNYETGYVSERYGGVKAGAGIVFSDEVESNREDDGSLAEVEFVDSDGQRVRLDQFTDQKNVLLVFTRGFSGELCPYCTTQTSRLIANYAEFTRRDTEVLLVYPGDTDQLGEFRRASIEISGKDEFPFPVLLDENLAVVNRLGIAAELAFPSTFIIDKAGQVRFAYVGASPSDRPSIKALLERLDKLAG